jgi:hypothetical protein
MPVGFQGFGGRRTRPGRQRDGPLDNKTRVELGGRRVEAELIPVIPGRLKKSQYAADLL